MTPIIALFPLFVVVVAERENMVRGETLCSILKKWFHDQSHRLFNSVPFVDRLIHSHMSSHSTQLKSCCYNDYSDTNQTLIPIAKKIFDVLFCSPTRTPWSEGNGIIISADSCFGNTPTINIHRKSYLRQNYGLDSTEVQSIIKMVFSDIVTEPVLD